MAYKKNGRNGMYKNTSGDMKDRRGFYMIQEDLSAPSAAPRENMSIEYPYVDCGGVYANDSVNMSDESSNKMVRKMHEQLIKETIF